MLTHAIADAIRSEYAAGGVSQQALADKYGVSQVRIGQIVRGKGWVAPAEAICLICAGLFPRRMGRGQNRYCSDECFIEGRKVRANRRYRAANPSQVRHCPHCGSEFTTARSDARFCTERCMQAAHNALRKAKWKVRDAAGVVVEEVSRAYIIERDRGRCHLCGRKCRADEIHLDHVVPLSRGGDHSAANVRVACARCNLSKRADARNEQLSIIG